MSAMAESKMPEVLRPAQMGWSLWSELAEVGWQQCELQVQVAEIADGL